MFNSIGVPFLINSVMRAAFSFGLVHHANAVHVQVLQQRHAAQLPASQAETLRLLLFHSPGREQENGLLHSSALDKETMNQASKEPRVDDMRVSSKVDAVVEEPLTYERGSGDGAVDAISTSEDDGLGATEHRASAQLQAGSGRGLFPESMALVLLGLRAHKTLVVTDRGSRGPVDEGRPVSWVSVGLQQKTLVAGSSGYLETSPARRRRRSPPEEQAADQSDGPTLAPGSKPVQGRRELNDSGDERGEGVGRASTHDSRVPAGAAPPAEDEPLSEGRRALASGSKPAQSGRGGAEANLSLESGDEEDEEAGVRSFSPDNKKVLVGVVPAGTAGEGSGPQAAGGKGTHAASDRQRGAGNPHRRLYPESSPASHESHEHPHGRQFLNGGKPPGSYMGSAPANMSRLQQEEMYLRKGDEGKPPTVSVSSSSFPRSAAGGCLLVLTVTVLKSSTSLRVINLT